MIQWHVEVDCSHFQSKEGGWKMVEWVLKEIRIDCELSERGGKVIHALVEAFSKRESLERRREVIHRLVEVLTKPYLSDGRRESGKWQVEGVEGECLNA